MLFNHRIAKCLFVLLLCALCHVHGTLNAAEKETFAKSSVQTVAQQEHKIKGQVVDITGEPLIGVNIIISGSNAGCVTDIDGYYELENVPATATLNISYIGYLTQEIKIEGRSSIDIILVEDTQLLEEVVIVGYGVQRKKDLTGAVSVLKLSEAKNTPVSNVEQIMQGKMSGVNVIPDNMPGGGVAVRIRGYSTIRNNDPLYIIDGVPVESGINFLNPNDIESMQVLKDASSASIYGARAANGVVIITTKKGEEGAYNITFDSYFGVQSSAKKVKMLNTQEYGNMLWQSFINDGKKPSSSIYTFKPFDGTTQPENPAIIPAFLDEGQRLPAADVDWVDQILRKATVQSYNISIAKADKKSNHLFSLGYFNQEGLMKHTGFNRISARLNAEYTMLDGKIKVGENLSISHSSGTTVNNNAALGGMLYNAYKTSAITPVYDLDGNFGSNPFADIANPLGQLYRNRKNARKTSRLFGNLYGEVKLTPSLTFKTNLGMDYTNSNTRFFKEKFVETHTQQPISTLRNTNNWRFNWVFSNTLSYTKSINLHSLDLLAGVETTSNQHEWFYASREGFPADDDNFHYLNAGDAGSQKNEGSTYHANMVSYFGKVNYNYDNRYLLSATIRRDGSSKLKNYRWGNFPAFSAGWRISSEEFYRIKAISDMKLRVGWGQNGNSDIPPYSTIDSYVSNPNHTNYPIDGSQNSVVTGYAQTRNGNPNLRWETTTQSNIGLDLAFLNNDLTATIDVFRKETNNLLWERSLIGTIGGTNQMVWDNVGKMLNQGIEMELAYNKSINHDLRINASINFSMIKNEMTELNGDISYIGLPTGMIHSLNFDQEVSRSAVGQPIGSYYVYKADGLFQSEEEVKQHKNSNGELLQPAAKPGDIRFLDLNNDGKIDGNDRDYLSNPLPKFTAGLLLGGQYKQFDFSFFFQTVMGNDVYDLTRYIGDFFNQSQYNKNSRLLQAWHPSQTNTTVPRVTMDDPNNNIRPSSYFIQDASFLRLKNAKIGYTVCDKGLSKLHLSKLYLYAQVTNLFTITKYQGIDPEVGLQSYSSDYRNLDMGVDRGIYPLPRTVTIGLNIIF